MQLVSETEYLKALEETTAWVEKDKMFGDTKRVSALSIMEYNFNKENKTMYTNMASEF